MLIIETDQVTFSCGDHGYYRVAYLSEQPQRRLRLCQHVHPTPLAAQQCAEARERARNLWTPSDFEKAFQLD